MLTLVAVCAGLCLYLCTTTYNPVLLDKPEPMTEAAFFGRPENVDEQMWGIYTSLDPVEDARLREIMAQNFLEAVTAWHDYCEVKRLFGHNGVVYYDHNEGRVVSTFVPTKLARGARWRLEQYLCIRAGYAAVEGVVLKTVGNTDRSTRNLKVITTDERVWAA